MRKTRSVALGPHDDANATATQHSAVPKFTTQHPQFAAEKSENTALFRALAHLQTQLATEWRRKLLPLDAEGGDAPLRGELFDAEVQVFFDTMLAPAIQARETALVNVMHECFQTELSAKQQLVHAQSQHIDTLVQQQTAHEKELAHWKSKLDRRVAANNELRKDFYKQLLMLRDLVNKQKNDPKTLKVLDDAIATIAMGKEKASEFTAMSAGAAATSRLDKQDPVGGSTSMRREKEKWEERAREAMCALIFVLLVVFVWV